MKISPLLRRLGTSLAAVLALQGCSSPVPNRDPLGERLPSVVGKTLDGREVRLPEDLAGGPAVLLVGYAQDAQFDADRWLFGLLQSKTPARMLEVPTIPGIFPGVFAGSIDSGMRSGIPNEDWGSVVTLYDSEASRLEEFTGRTGPRNMRVILLDAECQVRWFHDRGFSSGKLLELDNAVRGLPTQD